MFDEGLCVRWLVCAEKGEKDVIVDDELMNRGKYQDPRHSF
jgi:hypothetical protein